MIMLAFFLTHRLKLQKVIPIPNQLDYFGEYLTTLQLRIGKKGTQDLIRRAAVVISAGTNDFLVNYFALPFQKQKYTVEQYQHFLLVKLADFLQVRFSSWIVFFSITTTFSVTESMVVEVCLRANIHFPS